MIRNIIFDWSGTLVDDLPAVWRATNYVFKQAGVMELTLDEFRAAFCLPFKNFYSRYVPSVSLPQLEQWFHSHFREVQHLARELPHAREMLLFCRARGLRTFLLSTIHRDHFAAQSAATTLAEIVAELRQSRRSERQGRLIDNDTEASMERKKREGYF